MRDAHSPRSHAVAPGPWEEVGAATQPTGLFFQLLAADAVAAPGRAWQWVRDRGAAAAGAVAHAGGTVRATANRAGNAVSATAARTWGAVQETAGRTGGAVSATAARTWGVVQATAAHTGGAIRAAAAAATAAAAGAAVSAPAAVVTAAVAVAHGGRVAVHGMVLATSAGLTSLVPFLDDVQPAEDASIPPPVFSESGWPVGTVESVVGAAADAVDVAGPEAADAVTFWATVENWPRLTAAFAAAVRVGVAVIADEMLRVLCPVSGGWAWWAGARGADGPAWQYT